MQGDVHAGVGARAALVGGDDGDAVALPRDGGDGDGGDGVCSSAAAIERVALGLLSGELQLQLLGARALLVQQPADLVPAAVGGAAPRLQLVHARAQQRVLRRELLCRVVIAVAGGALLRGAAPRVRKRVQPRLADRGDPPPRLFRRLGGEVVRVRADDEADDGALGAGGARRPPRQRAVAKQRDADVGVAALERAEAVRPVRQRAHGDAVERDVAHRR